MNKLSQSIVRVDKAKVTGGVTMPVAKPNQASEKNQVPVNITDKK